MVFVKARAAGREDVVAALGARERESVSQAGTLEGHAERRVGLSFAVHGL